MFRNRQWNKNIKFRHPICWFFVLKLNKNVRKLRKSIEN